MSIVGYIRESCNNLETLRKMVGRARRARRKDTPIACQGTSPNCGVRISSERSEHCEAMSLEACAPTLPDVLDLRVFLYFAPKAGKFDGFADEIPLIWDGAGFSPE